MAASTIQALHICLPLLRSSPAAICAALRSAPTAHSLSQQPSARNGRSQRRPPAYQVVEAGQAGGKDAAVNLSGSGGVSTWQPLEAALDSRQPEVAWREFMQLLEQGSLPPVALCDRLIYALCGRRRLDEAWRAYAATTPAGYLLQYNTYQALITLALKAGNLDKAVDAFRDMQAGGRAANVVTYCGLISALGRERRRRGVRFAQTAHELWLELAGSGTQLDAAAYRTGLKACVDVGRLKDADKVLQRMSAAGMAPDVRSFNILLAGHSRAGSTGAMARLMQRMLAAGVQPSAVTYNTLVDGYVRAGDLAGALGVAERSAAAGVPLDVWTYSTLIKGHVQAGDLAAAERVLGVMSAAGVTPTCVTYTTLVDGHVRQGDMESARRVMQAMQAAGQAPNALTYNTLLRGYAAEAATASAAVAAAGSGGGGSGNGRAGDPAALAAALALLRGMQSQGVAPTADTFNTLMAAAVAAGQHQLALDLSARLLAAGLRPDALTYTTLIAAHGRLGQVAAAAEAFEALLRDRSAAPDLRAYNAMVDALARNADMPAAERMLNSAAELASKQGLPPPVEAYGAVVAGYARQLLVAPAVATVKRFHASGGSPDGQMLDTLANIAIRAGEYKVAMQAVRALELIGRKVDKAKYAALLEGQGEAVAAADRPQHNRTWAAYQKRREARQKNVQLERFKFWLGLPNSYYSSSESDADFSSSNSQSSPPASSDAGDWEEWEQRQWRQGQW